MTRELAALVGKEAYAQDDPILRAGPVGARMVTKLRLPFRASIRQDVDGEPLFIMTVLTTYPNDRNPLAVAAQFQWERKAFDDQWSLLSAMTRSDFGIIRPTTFGSAMKSLQILAIWIGRDLRDQAPDPARA